MKQAAFFQWVLVIVGLSLMGGCSQFSETVTDSESKKPVVPAWVIELPLQDQAYQARGVAKVAEGADSQATAKSEALNQAIQSMSQQLSADMAKAKSALRMSALQTQGQFEQAVRQAVHQTLPQWPLPAVTLKGTYYDADTRQYYVWAQWSYDTLYSQYERYYHAQDRYLRNYIHVSSAGSHLTQLLSILPALPTLEARQDLRMRMKRLKSGEPVTENDALAQLLNRQLSNQFDALNVSFNAQTEDSKQWEPTLERLMNKQGFQTTARRPDLLMKYYFEPEYSGEEAGIHLRLITDAELVGEKGNTFASVSESYSAQAQNREGAAQIALQEFSQEVTAKLVESSVNYLTQANKTLPALVVERAE